MCFKAILVDLNSFDFQVYVPKKSRWGPKIGILIFLLLRTPRKISEPYENPFWKKTENPEERNK